MSLALRLAGWAAWGTCSAIGSAVGEIGDAFIGMADEISAAMDRQEKRERRANKRAKAFDRTLREIEALPVAGE